MNTSTIAQLIPEAGTRTYAPIPQKCGKGHAMTPDNVRWEIHGRRAFVRCKECRREADQARTKRLKEKEEKAAPAAPVLFHGLQLPATLGTLSPGEALRRIVLAYEGRVMSEIGRVICYEGREAEFRGIKASKGDPKLGEPVAHDPNVYFVR